MTDGGKGGFDRVGGANMNPVLGRKVVKGQSLRSILGQDGDRLGVFGPEIPSEAVESLVRLGLGLSHPNFMQPRLGGCPARAGSRCGPPPGVPARSITFSY